MLAVPLEFSAVEKAIGPEIVLSSMFLLSGDGVFEERGPWGIFESSRGSSYESLIK